MIKLTNMDDNFSGGDLYIDPSLIASIGDANLHNMCIKKGDYPFLDENIYNVKDGLFCKTCSIKRTKITLLNGSIYYVKEGAEMINGLKNNI